MHENYLTNDFKIKNFAALTIFAVAGIFIQSCQREKDFVEPDYRQEDITEQNTQKQDGAIHGYSMPELEGILKNIFTLADVRSKLKVSKPTGITNKEIDVYLNFYNNL